MPTLCDHVDEHAARRPNRIAIRHRHPGGRVETLTYAALAELSRRVARALDREARDERLVPLYLARSGPAIATMLAAERTGRAFSWLYRRLRPPQIAPLLQAAGTSILVVDEASRRALERESTGAETRLLPLESFETLKTADASNVAEGPIDPSRTGAVLFTSGSTGETKGVAVSAGDLDARAEAEAAWFGLGPEDVLLAILPFSFDVGLNQLRSALRVGAEVVLLDSWLPADIVAAASDHGVTGISGVPTIWRSILNAEMSFDRHGPHRALRYVTVSGGDLRSSELPRLPDLVDGAGIFKTYGQTETFRTTSLRPEEFAERPRSVGRAFPGATFRVEREDGSACAAGEIGEVVHRGLGVMIGYLGDDHERPPDEVRTGDRGWVDAQGYLHLQGRTDSMVKLAGNRVYPAEIANHLVALSGVRDAEVVTGRAPDGEPALAAFVVLDGSEAGPALRGRLARRIPGYMIPRWIVVRSELPRLENGKPDRRRLRSEIPDDGTTPRSDP